MVFYPTGLESGYDQARCHSRGAQKELSFPGHLQTRRPGQSLQ